MESEKIMQEYRSVRSKLEELGLYGPDSQIMIRDELGRVCLDSRGRRVSPDAFGDIKSRLAVLTSGEYSKEYCALGRPVKASNDDMAMMFGYKIKSTDKAGRSDAYIIRDRGFIVSGRFESELIAACILMEKMCKTELTAPRIGKVCHLDPALCAIEHNVYLKKYSKKSAEAADEEPAVEKPAAADVPDLALREEVIKYGQLLVENRLIQATWGNISARIDDNRFLITPSGVDYYRIRPEDIVEIRIDDGSYAEGLHPSSEKKMHLLIYQERPDIKAIIHTHSSNCQVFAACRADLKTDELDYPCADYAVSGSGKLAENVAKVMADHDGCIMANHGFVAGARDLATALQDAIKADSSAGILLGAVK